MNVKRKLTKREINLSFLLGAMAGFLVFSIFGSLADIGDVESTSMNKVHIPLDSLPAPLDVRYQIRDSALLVSEKAKLLAFAKSMAENGMNGALVGGALGFALLVSRRRSEIDEKPPKEKIPLANKLASPGLQCVLLAVGIFVTGTFFFIFSGDLALKVKWLGFLFESLVVLVTVYPPTVLILIGIAVVRKWLPGKLIPGHRLDAVPWITMLAIFLWGIYWAMNPALPLDPRPENEGWLMLPALAAVPISLFAWVSIYNRRDTKRMHTLVLACVQMMFLVIVAFLALMLTMHDGP